jgi:Anaphase promoting complex subunit 8 / Cdc23
MAPVVVTTTSGEQDDSFSFFSPTSSTAAGTPSNYNSNYNNHGHSPLTPAGFRMRRSTGTSSRGSSSGIHPAAATDNDAAASGMELHVDWDPAILHRDLRHATTVLNHRGLKLAAKWTAEQWMGLPPSVVVAPESLASTLPEDTSSSSIDSSREMTPQDWYAKTLMDVGEYLHAAYVLSATTTTTNHNDTTQSSRTTTTTTRHQHPPMDDVLSMPPPAPHSTSFGIYLRAYALYMAGERRKEEEHLELQRYVHEGTNERKDVDMLVYFHSLTHSITHAHTLLLS